MKTPFFSVVIPVYNREDLVEKVVTSILDQAFQDFEIIIVDNYSKDKTVELVKSMQSYDNRIQLIQNSSNLERCISRNLGIQAAQGEYICFLDSDDFWLDTHLSLLYAFISTNNTNGLYFTNAYDSVDFGPLSNRVCPSLDDYPLFEYLLTFTFNPSRVAVHHSILQEFQFDPEIPGLEDFDLWLRIATKHSVFQLNERTVVYNIHNDSTTISELGKSDREIKLYKTVLSKEIFQGLLPVQSKKRLMSMCYYRRVLSLSLYFRPLVIHYYILKAYFLCREGYNKNANRTMLVIFIDQIPILGFVLKTLRKMYKRILINNK